MDQVVVSCQKKVAGSIVYERGCVNFQSVCQLQVSTLLTQTLLVGSKSH